MKLDCISNDDGGIRSIENSFVTVAYRVKAQIQFFLHMLNIPSSLHSNWCACANLVGGKKKTKK